MGTSDRVGRDRGRALALALGAVLLAASVLVEAQLPYRPLVQGGPAPDFALPDVTGRTVHLSDFRGRTILLSFVSCYTDTCLAALSDFTPLLEELGPARLAAPSVCTEVPAALREGGFAGLVRRCGAGQTLLIDDARAATDRYLVTEFPTAVLIGPDFAVREIVRGVPALRDPMLRSRIAALARETAPPPAPGP